MVSIKDIAEQLGLSLGTVSQVLNHNDQRYSAKTRQRILTTAEKLGYRPNLAAQSLLRGSAQAVGVMFTDLTGGLANQIMTSALPVFEAAGYRLLIGVSFWDPERERQELETFLEHRLDGILALPLASCQATYQAIQKANMPLVFFCDWLAEMEVETVAMDGFDAGFKMTGHLLAQGHRHIAFLGVDNPSEQLRTRQEGFLAALTQAGLVCEPELVLTAHTGDMASVHSITRNLLRRKQPPTALLAVGDPLALQVLETLNNLPGARPQLAVAGIGGLEISRHGRIDLSTVEEPLAEIGRLAAQSLIAQIKVKKTSGAQRQLVPGQLMRRGTTPPVPTTTPPRPTIG